MAKRSHPQPKTASVTTPDIGQELGFPNLWPISSWATWSGEATPGTVALGRDPLAPSLDELIFMLRRDGQAQAMLSLLTLPIRAAFAQSEWVAPTNVDGDATAEVQFANQMWSLPANAGGMKVSRSMFLRQTLLAIPHGFAAFEIVKQYREDGPLKGKYVIDKMAYRDPRTVHFLVDDKHGTYQGFRQQTNFAGNVINIVISDENSWYWAANEEHNPFYGISYFEAAFQHYQMKRKLYYIGHLAAQLAAVPGRIGEIPLGASPRQITEFKKGLADLHFNQAMLVAPNFKVTPFNGNSTFNPTILIDHHNMMMATSILAKFLQQEDRQVLIDNGKADASADMFVQMLEAITFELSESWSNRLMPQFMDYNFGTGIYPVHQFAPLTDEKKQTIYNLFNTIVGLANINCTPEFVRTTEMQVSKELGYQIDYDKIADEEAQIAKEQQEQATKEAAQPQQQYQQPDGPGVPGVPGQTEPQGPQGANAVQRGEPSPAPTLKGGRPPNVQASAKQQEAMNTIALALNELIGTEDVPIEYEGPDGEKIPEAGEL